MSHFIDSLQFFKKTVTGEFADGHGETRNQNREWENSYRQRWQHDKIVRSTHGVNCTGSCSWKIYVKNGLITWETQQTDYPRTRPDLPNHEPRGCPRGASYSWYIYSANRLKYPKVRKPLLKLWRDARKRFENPVDAWAFIVEDPLRAKSYKSTRGLGGYIRSSWEEVNEIIAAANVYTAKQYGPDRIIGFSPIPAMSMVSYAAGSRYLSLIGGVCLSFYDWYCDLPPASPMTWGEQTDVPESADWYNSNYIIAWGSNVPQTRTPDAHFLTEVRYKGAKTVAITPDYAEVAKLTDIWLSPKQGFTWRNPVSTSPSTCAATPTCRCWCCWRRKTATTAPPASCELPTWTANSARTTTLSGKPLHWMNPVANWYHRWAPSATAGANRANGISSHERGRMAMMSNCSSR